MTLEEAIAQLDQLKKNCKRTYDELSKMGLDLDASEDYSLIDWTGKWFDPNSCLAAHLYMVANSMEEATNISMAPKEDDSCIWIEQLIPDEITASHEKLLQAERQSMSRSAVIDYIRAENRQLREILGVDENVKDFSAGEKLRLLRVALAQSEEEVEHLKVELERARQGPIG